MFFQSKSEQPDTLDYESSNIDGTRFTFALETERTHVLRRRFLWFVGTLLVLSVPTLLGYSLAVLLIDAADERRMHLFSGIGLVAQCAVLIWAWLYAKRQRRDERGLYRFAFWIVVGLGFASLLSARVLSEMQSQVNARKAAEAEAARLTEAAEGEAQDEAIRPRDDGGFYFQTAAPFWPSAVVRVEPDEVPTLAVAPVAGVATAASGDADRPGLENLPARGFGERVAPGAAEAGYDAGYKAGAATRGLALQIDGPQGIAEGLVWIANIWWSVFITHLLATLFLPWTVREAWRPAQWLIVGGLGIAAFDVFFSDVNKVLIVLGALLLPLAPLPGLGWCWWRHSAFRRGFRLRFESDAFRRLSQELAGARRLHDAVMPPPRREGMVRVDWSYEPAHQIGGDLLFLHPRGDGTRGVTVPGAEGMTMMQPKAEDDEAVTMVLLDVTGHGVAAALSVNRLVGELERLVAESPEIGPGRIMRQLNRYVHLTLSKHGAFVTGLAARVDPVAGKLYYCGAGHPDAILRRADGTVERLPSDAAMIGMLPHRDFEAPVTEYAFGPGDAFVGYTDGASEAASRDGVMLGIDGVTTQVDEISSEDAEGSSKQIDAGFWPRRLLHRLADYRQGPPEDDTLVAVLFRPPEPPRRAATAVVQKELLASA